MQNDFVGFESTLFREIVQDELLGSLATAAGKPAVMFEYAFRRGVGMYDYAVYMRRIAELSNNVLHICFIVEIAAVRPHFVEAVIESENVDCGGVRADGGCIRLNQRIIAFPPYWLIEGKRREVLHRHKPADPSRAQKTRI